jgi:DNA-binding NtrC family response regulator
VSETIGSVLVVDDERAVREEVGEALSEAGHEVRLARNADHALSLLREQVPDLMLCDLRMPGMDGMALLKEIRQERPEVNVLLMTAYASVETAVEALKSGASDYLLKPLVIDELLAKVTHLLTFRQLARENQRLREELTRLGGDLYVGVSRAMSEVARTVARAAPMGSTVLVTGESGTGKDVVARAIHRQSDLSEQPFVVVDLGAIPEALIESQLFGSVKGAFTGASAARKGLFQAANGGTLFLDEVGNLSLEAQSKLLRAIESGEVLPVGGTQPMQARVRLIAATNRDLKQSVADGEFRQDLYYRLNVLEIRMPPLRERKDDVPGLAQFLLQKLNASLRTNYAEIHPDATLRLMDHDWPGNIRELQNVLERAMVLGDGLTIGAEDLPLGQGERAEEDLDLRKAIRGYEREHIQRALVATGWSRKEAARRLGISTTSLWRRMTDLGIEEPES